MVKINNPKDRISGGFTRIQLQKSLDERGSVFYFTETINLYSVSYSAGV